MYIGSIYILVRFGFG